MKTVALALALVSAVFIAACEQQKPPLMPDNSESNFGLDGGTTDTAEPVVPAPASSK